jgi:hypothetical protein
MSDSNNEELMGSKTLERRQRMFGNRPMLRAFIRGQIRNNPKLTPEQKNQLQQSLRDGDVIDSSLLEIAARPQAPADGIRFLDWLLDNADEIIAIIIKIISLL